MNHTFLKRQWNYFWSSVQAQGNREKEFQKIKELHKTPIREYHNLNHIEEMLRDFRNVKNLLEDKKSLEMAIWFHDAIYDSTQNDNEEKSAELSFQTGQKLQIDSIINAKAYALILATKKHYPTPNPDSKYLIDIDFGILGKHEKRFKEYEQQIREEYKQYPDEIYNPERKRILQSFLDRKNLYHAQYFKNKYEKQARSNLKNLISQL